MSEIDTIKSQYLEAVRLHLWYTGSKFSFFQGKTSKELSERYRRLAQNLYDSYIKKK